MTRQYIAEIQSLKVPCRDSLVDRYPIPSVHIKNTSHDHGPNDVVKFPVKNNGFVSRVRYFCLEDEIK